MSEIFAPGMPARGNNHLGCAEIWCERLLSTRLGRFAVLPARSAMGRVSRTHRLSKTVRNCTRDEGGPFETGSQVQVSSHRKLLSSRAMVVSVAETSGPDPGRRG